jgi:hypothetical protein
MATSAARLLSKVCCFIKFAAISLLLSSLLLSTKSFAGVDCALVPDLFAAVAVQESANATVEFQREFYALE